MTYFGLTVFSYVPTSLVSLKSNIDAGVPMQLDHEVDEGILVRRREPLDKLETLWTPNLDYATLHYIRQVCESGFTSDARTVLIAGDVQGGQERRYPSRRGLVYLDVEQDCQLELIVAFGKETEEDSPLLRTTSTQRYVIRGGKTVRTSQKAV
ncbi:MAG: hypothetical protein J3R72DRAFT_417715 [Linnemannia gamsii]|nr:MAG: hypothetical protein J3R72DRAFT_417715 [Linnemannia gamsii]